MDPLNQIAAAVAAIAGAIGAIAALAHATQLRRQTDRPRPADRGTAQVPRAPVAPAEPVDEQVWRGSPPPKPPPQPTGPPSVQARRWYQEHGIKPNGWQSDPPPTADTPTGAANQWWLNKRNKADRNSSPVQRQGRR